MLEASCAAATRSSSTEGGAGVVEEEGERKRGKQGTQRARNGVLRSSG